MNRLHPRIRLLWIGRSVLSAAVLGGLFAGVLWYFTIPQSPYGVLQLCS